MDPELLIQAIKIVYWPTKDQNIQFHLLDICWFWDLWRFYICTLSHVCFCENGAWENLVLWWAPHPTIGGWHASLCVPPGNLYQLLLLEWHVEKKKTSKLKASTIGCCSNATGNYEKIIWPLVKALLAVQVWASLLLPFVFYLIIIHAPIL